MYCQGRRRHRTVIASAEVGRSESAEVGWLEVVWTEAVRSEVESKAVRSELCRYSVVESRYSISVAMAWSKAAILQSIARGRAIDGNPVSTDTIILPARVFSDN